ncbi:hypothetical protein Vau01_021030 [Virgisporangium aurantiacum]|uniref:Uncharacterized protein n=1 Tax=Virgisporangium aurantiacum TaxID=175570 RepID=A0A8J3Z166_9ACTN|nr:hypothetical protein Vau01_021030 [Virgisporangium aurantiacum]
MVPMSGDGGGGTAEAGCATDTTIARTATNSIKRFMVLVLSIPREDVSRRPSRAL